MRIKPLARPHPSDYTSMSDYIRACGSLLSDHDKACLLEIDRQASKGKSGIRSTTDAPKPKPVTELERIREAEDTLHDYISARPRLLAIQRKYGLNGVLRELGLLPR